jgi:hypothetical protein
MLFATRFSATFLTSHFLATVNLGTILEAVLRKSVSTAKIMSRCCRLVK